jgi:hypothetical protein
MDSKIVGKIKKLLNLGNNAGASEGERDNALRMAQALMVRHNLDESILATTEIEREQSHFKVYADRWRTHLAVASAKLFFCETYKQSYKGRPALNTVAFIGRKDNVITAMEMAKYLTQSIDKEARKLGMGTSFKTGASAAVYWRVIELIEKPIIDETSSCTALTVISLYKQEEEQNKDFMVKLNLVLKETKPKKISRDGAEYKAGQAFGKTINLQNQIAA